MWFKILVKLFRFGGIGDWGIEGYIHGDDGRVTIEVKPDKAVVSLGDTYPSLNHLVNSMQNQLREYDGDERTFPEIHVVIDSVVEELE